MIGRRGFLSRTLGVAWAGASVIEQAFFRAARARAQSTGAPATLFDIEKVADGVWAALARPVTMINSNAAIFELGGDLLVVDTHSKPSAAAALVAQIRNEVSPKPVRYIVVSHFHWDHSQGTAAYRSGASPAQVISSTATRNLLSEFGAARVKTSLEELPKSIENYEGQAAAAKTPADKTHFSRMAAESRAYLAEMTGYVPELPSITFDRDLALHSGNYELRLAFRGRGHTAGDVVVFSPASKVAATGDLLHGFLPYIGDGYPREWPGTLRAAGELEFEHVIGGHGAVQHGRERLAQMAAYIEELAEKVDKAKRDGRSQEQLQKDLTPAALKSLAGGYGDFVTATLQRFTLEAGRSSAADVLARGVSDNVASVFKALDRT